MKLDDKRIGELNGPWAFLLKISLVVVPIMISSLIGWAVWATQKIMSLEITSALNTQASAQIITTSLRRETQEKESRRIDRDSVDKELRDIKESQREMGRKIDMLLTRKQ